MKILLVGPFSLSPRWGVENVIYNLVEGLCSNSSLLAKYGMHIVVISDRIKDKSLLSLCENIDVVGMSYSYVPLNFAGDFKNAMLTISSRELIETSDIIHSHDIRFSFPVFSALQSFSHNHNIRLIYQFHGLFWKEKYLSYSHTFDYDLLTLRSIGLSKLPNLEFISISKYVKDELIHFLNIPSYKIHILYNPISSKFFKIKKSEVEGVLFYPARLIPRKNHVLLLKALGRTKQEYNFSEFTLILPGPIENLVYYQNLLSLIRKYNLNDNIRFVGFISENQLLYYYKIASIVPITSREETFSLALAEAMATGTPVVSTPVGVAPEIISNGYNGFLVPPDDVNTLADVLYALLADKDLRKRLSKSSKKTAKIFRSDFIAKNLIRLWIEGESKIKP